MAVKEHDYSSDYHFDAVGWSKISATANRTIGNEYHMWRKEVFGTAPADLGTEDNRNQILSPRIADRI